VKPLLSRLIFLALAQDAFAQAGSAAGPAGDVAYCASLAGQIAELQGAKARVEQLNERATTSLGVNPQSENFVIPQIMERVEAQRRDAEALRQSIEVRKSSILSEWDAGLRTDTEKYNALLAGIKRDLAEIQSRQDAAMQQISLNRATHGYDQAVGTLERLQALSAARGCR
jgi:hypothetical protein